jgi:PAS domain S-box-containing protein
MMGQARKAYGALVGTPERLWDLSGDLMAVSDVQGRVLSVNQAWEAVLGWPTSELLAHGTKRLIHPDDLPSIEAELTRVTAGAESLRFESRHLGKDGRYRWVSWRSSSADGLIYSVGRDITERLNREEAARHAQKMEAIGQLTGGIAHDFNNLLTIVRSSIDLLKKNDLPPARRQRYVEAIDEAVGRAVKVTQQLLAFARRQNLAPEVFDVGERIADVSELLREMVGPKIRIETAVPLGDCHIEADLCQFETALMNLAINARDAMSGEGRLTIRATIVNEIPALRSHAATPGEFVAVSVQDTGAGMDAQTQARVFEPFFTTKEIGQGTGLGLSQVYGFVKQSGGSVEVISEPGAGATFVLYLPRAKARAGAPAQKRADGPRRRRSQGAPGLRALVVEDNEEVGEFCVSLMHDLGYRPVWARNAAEALSYMNSHRHDCDLIFSDVVMPGMSGIELAEEIRRSWPNMPILLTSGYSAILAEEGARGFPLLAKPYSAGDLEQALLDLMRANGAERNHSA